MSGYDLAVGRRWGIINSADQHRSRFSSPLRLDHSVAQRSENASQRATSRAFRLQQTACGPPRSGRGLAGEGHIRILAEHRAETDVGDAGYDHQHEHDPQQAPDDLLATFITDLLTPRAIVHAGLAIVALLLHQALLAEWPPESPLRLTKP
jgi:hypothetical protein